MTREDLKTKLWKMIPLGLAFTIVVQALVWMWWMASFAATTLRLDNLEAHKLSEAQVPERLAVLATKVELVSEQIKELRLLIIKTQWASKQ